MHIGFYAGRRVALLNRAAPSLIDRCVFCGKPTLLIVSFPVASSLACCMHQQMHMLANFGRSICARSSSSQGLCIIRLAACLSCLVCMQACEIRLVRFPCRPSTIISLRSAFINASHWNCVCRCFSLRRQSFSLVLNKLRCCGLLFEVASSVASSSGIRVVFPRRGREALFLVCRMSVDSVPFMKAHSCRPLVRLSFSVACVYRHKNWKRQTVLFSLRVAVSSPCRVAALHLRVSCLRLSVLMHGPGLDVAFGVLAAGPCAENSPQAASRRAPG